MLRIVPAAALANWDAAFVVEQFKLLAGVAEACGGQPF
jgi:hypothetical protein